MSSGVSRGLLNSRNQERLTVPYRSSLSAPQKAGSIIWDDRLKCVYVSTGTSWAGIGVGDDAIFLRGREIEDVVPADNTVYVYDSGTNQWRPTHTPGNCTSIAGQPVSANVPLDDEVLVFSGGEWIPAPVPTLAQLFFFNIELTANTAITTVNASTGAYVDIDTTGATFTNDRVSTNWARVDNTALVYDTSSTDGDGELYVRALVTASAQDADMANEPLSVRFDGINSTTDITITLAGIGVTVTEEVVTILTDVPFTSGSTSFRLSARSGNASTGDITMDTLFISVWRTRTT